MPPGNLNRLLWLAVIVAIVVFGYKVRDNFESYFASVGTLEVAPPDATGTLTLSWRGRIAAPMAQKIQAAYDKYGSDARKVVLKLSSPGGSLVEGRYVISILHKIGRSRELEARVDAGRMCASMCVPVYLAAKDRVASARARFMFHQVSFSDFYDGRSEDVPASAKEKATAKLFATYFRPAGVPEGWITEMEGKVSGGRDVWMSGEALASDGSNIVQRVE